MKTKLANNKFFPLGDIFFDEEFFSAEHIVKVFFSWLFEISKQLKLQEQKSQING